MYSKFSAGISSRFLAFGRCANTRPPVPPNRSLSPCALLSTDTASSPTFPVNCEQSSKRVLTGSPPFVPFSPCLRQTAVHTDVSRNIHQKATFNFEVYEDHLRIDFGEQKASKFHYIWLRDNCRCSSCFHSYTKQRLLDTFQIPLDIRPSEVQAALDGVTIQWTDGHSTYIPVAFLKKYSYDPPLGDKSKHGFGRTFWNRNIVASMPAVHFEGLFQEGEVGERAVLEWLRKINRYGFCLVDGVPLEPAMTKKLLSRISFIRETHYGGFWDFTANMEHGDTAYTNLPLGAHTDTTYFSDPAGLQLFHLLSPVESHAGGRSLLVDGFAAASRLKEKHSWAYNTLAQVPIETHASGELAIVRWNPDDRCPLQAKRGDEIKRWYSAAREWEKIIKSPEMELWTQMKMGQALIFDNHRVLHGRSGFTGSRRLCGGYINGDDYRSRLRSLDGKFRSTASNILSDDVWNEIH